MLFVKDVAAYAKVWKVEKKSDKYLDLRISTSEKSDDGTYKNSTWFPRCIGHAFNSLANVKEGDKILITKCKLTNETYTAEDGKKKSAFRFLILEASVQGDGGAVPTESNVSSVAPSVAVEDSPW